MGWRGDGFRRQNIYSIRGYCKWKWKTTGYSPLFLMFGREERIPIEQNILGNINRCKNDWVKSMRKMIIETNYRVKVALEKAWKTRSDGIIVKY